MRFYFYISCIDTVWEGIQQLHRIFFDTNSIPFENENIIFKDNIFKESDNKFFKTIRACFGAHPVNLSYGDVENERKFASWSYDNFQKDCFSICLYSNIPGKYNLVLSVSIKEIDEFFEIRYRYLEKLIKRIDYLEETYKNKFKKIEIVEDTIKQIEILKCENKQRMNLSEYDYILNIMQSFFETNFTCNKNKNIIENFKNKMILAITEIINSL